MKSMVDMKTGFAGGGKMAEAIIKGLRNSGVGNIIVYDPSAERLKYLKKSYGVRTVKSNLDVLKLAEIIVLAVKPADIKNVCKDIKENLTRDKLVISIAAGITLAFLRYNLGTDRIVRVMPNAPAFVGEGMTVIASSPGTKKRDIAVTGKIFSQVGDVLVLDEKNIDAVTALSGSGPAFISLFIEALVDGAVRMGIARDDASRLAIKTAEGTLALLNSGITTSRLRDMVTSPAGTTAEGLYVMEREGFKGLVIEAVEEACEKASDIAHQVSGG
ncbi:pyrroline-5-carboxylate reductase [bacterium BMS3Bbin05]|nr:pyrroline-5-carboxylate reductase [bacterium BMS3Bbin05]HDO22972.1 pyrroline-5-carboxylate reductase [Nitrospirota bacterium]HDZ87293.1 pyrroline-5-carboxylate reductase [Nitrospirota bacterium]